MAKDTVRMPSSTAGITSFGDSGISKRRVTPAQVIIIIVVMILVVAALHIFGRTLL
jgi:preprotein translocase subunit Sec61beta